MALKINGYDNYAYNYSLTSKCTKPLHLLTIMHRSKYFFPMKLPILTSVFPPSLSCSLSICIIYICVVVSLFNEQTKYSRMANIFVFNPNQCLECTMYFKIFIVGFSCVEVMFIYRLSIGMPVMDMNKRLCLEICFIAWSLIGWHSKFLLFTCLICHERSNSWENIISY